MGGQCEHDEIGIGSINAMALVGIIVGGASFLSDEFHDLVLAFTRAVGIRKDDSEILPHFIAGKSLPDVDSDSLCNVAQERRSWGNLVGVETLFVDIFLNVARSDLHFLVLFEQSFLLFF